jgi:hypothetical protein
MVLSPEAEKLREEIEAAWQLNSPTRSMLRTICETRSVLEIIDGVLAVEGLVISDQKGSCKAHPLAVLAKDLRNSVSQQTQRLLSNLG